MYLKVVVIVIITNSEKVNFKQVITVIVITRNVMLNKL